MDSRQNRQSLKQVRHNAAAQLRPTSDSASLDADCLISHVLNVPRSRFYSHPEDMVAAPQQQLIQALLERRKLGEPVAYLTGTQEFWSMSFEVNADVLIPRAATETLVEQALTVIPRNHTCSVLELGTGSGAIAIALAQERPKAKIVATDNSLPALAVAMRNAERHAVTSVEFVLSDWFEQLASIRFDVIVSNPPYIAHDDPDIEQQVKQHEPSVALFSAANGMAAFNTIVAHAGQHLVNEGHVMLEHGWQQQQLLATLLAANSFSHIRCVADQQQLPRVTHAQINIASVENSL